LTMVSVFGSLVSTICAIASAFTVSLPK
jgi:hypothetical protein